MTFVILNDGNVFYLSLINTVKVDTPTFWAVNKNNHEGGELCHLDFFITSQQVALNIKTKALIFLKG